MGSYTYGSARVRCRKLDAPARGAVVKRGDRVVVTEPGIRDWTGTVKAIKPTPKHGLSIEVERDGTDHECWVVAEAHVRKEED